MFLIASNPATFAIEWTTPAYVSPKGIVGVLRVSEAIEFEAREDAEAYLAGMRPDDVRFYSLAVIEKRPLPAPRGNGWMKGNPAYDLA